MVKGVVKIFAAAALLACAPGAAGENAAREFARMPPKLTAESSAVEVLAACRAMLPDKPVELAGALILRNRRGIVSKEFSYSLFMRRDPDIEMMKIRITPRDGTNVVAEADVSRRPGAAPAVLVSCGEGEDAGLSGRILGTDVTWLDLTFDFLWWKDAVYEAEREGESVHGQKCSVILVKPPAETGGVAAVRLWADKKTGCLMQAEQLDGEMKPLRRMWGTRVKKFGGRWMASVLEVETSGARHRTKITVEKCEVRE